MLLHLFLLTLLSCEPINLTILGTNDIHGKLTPIDVYKPNGTLVNIGGLSLLSSYFKIVKKEYPNLLWLDAGDQYTGTLESSLFNGQTITSAFNIIGKFIRKKWGVKGDI
jgi:2',3'-cyclic-nucleotide 2'-phosphodiesterase (5'-nucleotidase family)